MMSERFDEECEIIEPTSYDVFVGTNRAEKKDGLRTVFEDE